MRLLRPRVPRDVFRNPVERQESAPIEVLSVDGPVHGTIRYVLMARDIQLRCSPDSAQHVSNLPPLICGVGDSAADIGISRRQTLECGFGGGLGLSEYSRHCAIRVRLSERAYHFEQPTVRLEFERAVTDEEMDRLVSVFVAWDHLIVLGGYLETVDQEAEALNDSLSSQETHLAAPDTVEHAFY